MKKYVKPALFYENFDLTEHVAAGCQIIMNEELDPNSCKGDADGLGISAFPFIFATDAACGSTDGSSGVYTEYGNEEGYCYYAYDGGLFPTMIS